jgi:hypothetical protein
VVTPLAVIVAALLAAVGLTALITLVLARFLSSSFALGLIAGLTLPTFTCLYGLYDLANLKWTVHRQARFLLVV